MYNRYIPQSDGTYQRKRIPDPPVCPPPPSAPCPAPQRPVPCPPPEPPRRPIPPRPRQRPVREPETLSITGFFRQLLPRDFDTGDLLVVLLLLLMSGDCADDQNTALLTLVLYLFL